MNLLIVDADQHRRAQLTEGMRDFDGSDVFCFSSAEEALVWGTDQIPDCIVFSDDLFGMNCLEFFRSFRALQRNAMIPAIMTGVGQPQEIRRQALALGVAEFLPEPLDYPEFPLRVANLVSLRNYDQDQHVAADWLAAQVNQGTAMIREREREIIVRLSHLAEYRDSESRYHMLRVAEYCRAIARGADLRKDFEETMLAAAPMHDIGKIVTPDYLIYKTEKLTQPEIDLMKLHTTVGHEILSGSSSTLLQAAADIALTHHERYDGSGYPRGLVGPAIPLAGRICALADAFDAMTSERPYRPALSVVDAISEIDRCSNSHFDPTLVAAFKAELQSVVEAKERLRDDQH
jgi:response regulator RpfG family c-di-GMP phosphodiesterase